MRLRNLCAVAAAVALSPLAPGTAAAEPPPPGPVVIPLLPLNRTVANGTATLTPTPDGGLRVQTNTSGLVPNQPHAQHVHGNSTGKDFVCPPPTADTNGDGYISVPEGLPFYGPIDISLTTQGDTSPSSGLALARFPVADPGGNLVYDRTLSPAELPAGTLAQLANLTVVQHGIDVDGNDMYNLDSPIGESQFAKSLGSPGVPSEGTFPADCGAAPGAAANAPTGGVASGDGSTAPRQGS